MQSNENSNVADLPRNSVRKKRAETYRCDHKRGSVQCCQVNGHAAGHRYKCAGKYCPGLPWPASVFAHGVNCTTGGIRE